MALRLLFKPFKSYLVICLLGFFSLGLIVTFKLNPEETLPAHRLLKSEVTAQSAIVMERSSRRVLFEKNSHKRLLTASIAKILATFTAIELLDLNRYIVVDSTVLQATGSRIYLEVGEIIQIRDLLYGMMLQSGNDASLMVAKAYSGNIEDFVIKMNDLAQTLRMTDSFFQNPTGLDENESNYSTAYDMALLTAYAMENETFRQITRTKVHRFETPDGKSYVFYNKHRLIQEEPKVIGGKTGFTKKAGRTLVTVFNQAGLELIVVTFDAYGDWELHKRLAEEAFANYSMEKILSPFTFRMSTFHLLTGKGLTKPVFFPLKDEEAYDLKLTLRNNEFYLSVKVAGEEWELPLATEGGYND